MSDKEVATIKLLLIGSSGVGKSALTVQFTENAFNEASWIATVGVDLQAKTIQCDGKFYKAVVFDTAGQERYRSITRNFYRGAQGIMLVYDITNKKTFQDIDHWVEESLIFCSPNAIRMIVGNKYDKSSEREVHHKDISNYSKNLIDRGIDIEGFYEVTAKENEQVNDLFLELARGIINNKHLRKENNETDSIDLQSSTDIKQSGCSC